MSDISETRPTPLASSLDALRAEIDRLDDNLLELVEQRIATARAVAACKEADGDGLLKMRPRREATVIARLTAQARETPPGLVAQLWRTLMSYGLQVQGGTELVLCSARDPALLQEQVRARFGPAASIVWASAPAEAVAAARDREAVAVIEHGLPFALEEADGLVMFDTLHDSAGSPVAVAIGRVAPEDVIVEAGR